LNETNNDKLEDILGKSLMNGGFNGNFPLLNGSFNGPKK
jgi:hypothetical protein